MNPSNITPEIIATKIFEYRKVNGMTHGYYYEDPRPGNYKILEKNELPTFKESEWTGPLLEKAASIGKFKIETPRTLFQKEGIYWLCVNEKTRKVSYNQSLNYAIAGAILEAIGE